jgi:putative Mn2+ efflux pump MntP
VIALLLVAAALGLSNLAAAVGIGVSGVQGRVRIRVALVFGVFEAGMPVLGMLAGHAVSTRIGGAANWAGGVLLVAVGCVQVIGTSRLPGTRGERGGWSGWRLLVSGLALSIDNLVVGFALGAYHVTLALAAVVIGVVSVAMSLAGLELGAKAGAALGERGELAGGVVLVAVGVLIAAGVFLATIRAMGAGTYASAARQLLAVTRLGQRRKIPILVEVELAILDTEHERVPLGLGKVQFSSLGLRRVEHHVELALAGLMRGGGSVGGDDDLDPAFR